MRPPLMRLARLAMTLCLLTISIPSTRATPAQRALPLSLTAPVRSQALAVMATGFTQRLHANMATAHFWSLQLAVFLPYFLEAAPWDGSGLPLGLSMAAPSMTKRSLAVPTLFANELSKKLLYQDVSEDMARLAGDSLAQLTPAQIAMLSEWKVPADQVAIIERRNYGEAEHLAIYVSRWIAHYEREKFSDDQIAAALRHLVPVSVLKDLEKRYKIPRAVLIASLAAHKEFTPWTTWLDDASVLIPELSARTGSQEKAWEQIHEEGLEATLKQLSTPLKTEEKQKENDPQKKPTSKASPKETATLAQVAESASVSQRAFILARAILEVTPPTGASDPGKLTALAQVSYIKPRELGLLVHTINRLLQMSLAATEEPQPEADLHPRAHALWQAASMLKPHGIASVHIDPSKKHGYTLAWTSKNQEAPPSSASTLTPEPDASLSETKRIVLTYLNDIVKADRYLPGELALRMTTKSAEVINEYLLHRKDPIPSLRYLREVLSFQHFNSLITATQAYLHTSQKSVKSAEKTGSTPAARSTTRTGITTGLLRELAILINRTEMADVDRAVQAKALDEKTAERIRPLLIRYYSNLWEFEIAAQETWKLPPPDTAIELAHLYTAMESVRFLLLDTERLKKEDPGYRPDSHDHPRLFQSWIGQRAWIADIGMWGSIVTPTFSLHPHARKTAFKRQHGIGLSGGAYIRLSLLASDGQLYQCFILPGWKPFLRPGQDQELFGIVARIPDTPGARSGKAMQQSAILYAKGTTANKQRKSKRTLKEEPSPTPVPPLMPMNNLRSLGSIPSEAVQSALTAAGLPEEWVRRVIGLKNKRSSVTSLMDFVVSMMQLKGYTARKADTVSDVLENLGMSYDNSPSSKPLAIAA